ncbi:hypothetical protein L1987_75764 [Smallanthus sonchifolius]|uniref:Uncharacterized protein n=1 Tax=Smallanthus sonchifolius TaxID=185202 RepID=A0ACB9A7E5_9ASTR|nr:hypothetical protein L1987_75764 [Smallanthus sonchifolius]
MVIFINYMIFEMLSVLFAITQIEWIGKVQVTSYTLPLVSSPSSLFPIGTKSSRPPITPPSPPHRRCLHAVVLQHRSIR